MYLEEMKRLFSLIIFLFCHQLYGQTNINLYDERPSTFYSLNSLSISNLNSDSYFTISPRFYYLNSTSEKSNYSTFFYGGKFSSKVKNKIYIDATLESIKSGNSLHVQDFIDSLEIFPGKARIIEKGYYTNFRIKYNASKYFTFSTGKSSHFIGDGYRSLFLSDESSSYPFFLIKTSVWKIHYYNLFTTFLDIQQPDNDRKKHSTIHYLDFSLNKNISFGIFESVIWQAKGEGYNRGYDIEYLNPVIFYRPVEFSKASPDNVLMGLNGSFTYKHFLLYTQFILDDLNISRRKQADSDNYSSGFFQNKFGYQLGLKISSPYQNIPLSLLFEYNQVQPYTYAHKTAMQSYTHYNQALTHPAGANFKEAILLLNYQIKKSKVLFKYNYIISGKDTNNTHYGQNIFLSDFEAERDGEQFSYGNFNGQGIKTNLQNIYAEYSYSFSKFDLVLGLAYRDEKSSVLESRNFWLNFGIRSEFFNPFLDY